MLPLIRHPQVGQFSIGDLQLRWVNFQPALTTAIPTDRRDLRAGQEYVARPRGDEWDITEGRDRARGRERS